LALGFWIEEVLTVAVVLERFQESPSKNYGWEAGVGDRNGRHAVIIDNGKVMYAENEKNLTQVTVSGVDAVLKSL
jgi:peroxiredoxin